MDTEEEDETHDIPLYALASIQLAVVKYYIGALHLNIPFIFV